MATVVATTLWSQVKNGTNTTFTVTLSQPTTAGTKLIAVSAGGAIVTMRITNSSGTLFTTRTPAGGAQVVSVQDYPTLGSETTVFVTLNGAENVAGIIYEVANVGAFLAASNNGTGAAAAQASDFQVRPSSSVNVASGSALLVAGWSMTATAAGTPYSQANKMRQFGPLGKFYADSFLQPGANTQFIWASGLADVTAAGRYPANLASAGDYRATSMFNGTNTGFAAQAIYADASGVPTVPAPANAATGENSLPGTHNTNWYAGQSNATNSTIAGYTDQTSYAPGDTVSFKVDSSGFPFRVEPYRLGWYGSEVFGARLMTGNQGGYITGTVVTQPSPTVDGTLGSTSCAWTTNATWTIPAGTPSGVYYYLLRRTDITTNIATGYFIVRPTSAQGRVAVAIPDLTYQAYNVWGATTDHGDLATGTWTGRSVYQSGTDGGTPNFSHRAYGVSFDRPYSTQASQQNTSLFDSDQPLITFLEGQGYDLVYYSSLDLDANTTLLNTAKMVVMLGHHEYWTKNIYDCFNHALDAGVNMMAVASNVALWRVRFAVGDVNRRTMICYKDSRTQDVSAGWSGTGFDPVEYTGTWWDTRTAGNVNNPDIRRVNALTGQAFGASAPLNLQYTVPFAAKSLPIWRNSASIQALTSGQTYTTPAATIGDEADLPDGSTGQPDNLVNLSPTTVTFTTAPNANGTIYNTTLTNVTAGFTLYRRRTSGALILMTGSWRGWLGVSRWAKSTVAGVAFDANWQNGLNAIMYDLGAAPTLAQEMRPGLDTTLTPPTTGAPTGGRSGVAIAYGLRAPEDGNCMPFFGG